MLSLNAPSAPRRPGVLEVDSRTDEVERLVGFGSWEWLIAPDRVLWSPHLFEVFGVSAERVVPSFAGYLAQVHPDDRPEAERVVIEALTRSDSFSVVFRALEGGGTRWLEGRGLVVRGLNGVAVRMYGIVLDVTTTRTFIEELAQHADVERAVFEHMGDLVIACDAEGTVIALNRAMAEATGHGPPLPGEPHHFTDVLGYSTIDGERLAADDGPIARALHGETVTDAEVTYVSDAGAEMSLVISTQSFRDPTGRILGAIAIARDVTDQRRTEARLAHAVEHDVLTGLLHRPAFVSGVDAALNRARLRGWTTAVLAVDLDGWADAAEEVESALLDEVIVEVSQSLVSVLSEYQRGLSRGESMARSGSGRFLVCLEGVSGAAVAGRIATRLQEVISGGRMASKLPVPLSASIGVAVSLGMVHVGEALADAAVIAVGRATERGRGQTEITVLASEDHSRPQVAALQRALDEGEFVLEYQPKIALSSGRITGMEALLRWDDPTRGRVAPLDFIPLAESSGLIRPIGVWVLRSACEEAQRLSGLFPEYGDLVVAVNVSSRQFDADLADTVAAVLAATGLAPARLCLEITESVVMENADAAVATLNRLKALGVKISIDDFGTGYSSLAYLRRFPLDELKIDRAFVDGLGRDPEDTAIVAAIMGMAHALGLSTVAEGVETVLQESSLRNLGCDDTQGYLRCRPQPAAGLEDFLRVGITSSGDGDEVAAPTVVVMDDLAEVRLLVRASLLSAGYTVHEAERGDEGLNLVRRVVPDCVILDVNMPGKSGLEICQILRGDPATSNITIVMLTADNQATDKVAAYALDADDYVVKPFAPRDLVNRVNMALRRRRLAA